MKYSSHLNGQLVFSSDSIIQCVKFLTNPISDCEENAWNKYFKKNYGVIVNNEETIEIWRSIVIDNNKTTKYFTSYE